MDDGRPTSAGPAGSRMNAAERGLRLGFPAAFPLAHIDRVMAHRRTWATSTPCRRRASRAAWTRSRGAPSSQHSWGKD
ncbi:hypothetical protein STRIP9103_00979 [Streptomyces ipomoeae 91-03]|uniref:Uncharacterized protein n=1 Tax=Streptomyces ipomoeae 91-03 TaxID=698759 RepID=L1KJC0_9ACTN|nr:hypothetical protein STRIP9103_00979 [Streptomyces ipomoeae 91-03]